MNFLKRSVAFVIIIAVVLSTVCVMAIPAAANDESATYSKKVVSVLFDNSGSMANESRYEYAMYSIQALMALLGPNDTLVVTPMNKPNKTSAASSINDGKEVDLSDADNRGSIVQAFLKDAMFHKDGSNTPSSSVKVALDQLLARGMTPIGSKQEDENVEYWLFMLTDGGFESTRDQRTVENVFAEYVDDYNNFHMVYLGMGAGAIDLTSPIHPKLAVASNYTAYYTKDVAEVMTTIQSIANQISGRFTTDSSSFRINGNTVTIPVGADYALRNISVLLQDSGVTLVEAKLNGNKLSSTQEVVLKPTGLSMKDGYCTVLSSNGLLSGGNLELIFSGPIDADNFSLMYEPALWMKSIIEAKVNGTWTAVDNRYINSELSKGQKIRVRYEIYEEGSNRQVDSSKFFGKTTEKVTYAGNAYSIMEEISLVVGRNTIDVSVSAMNGAYNLYSSMPCFIDENHNDYRVEVNVTENGGGVNDVTFKVFFGGSPVNASGLSKYDCKITTTDSLGNQTEVKGNVNSDGTVSCKVDTNKFPAGKITVTMEVTDPDDMYRKASAEMVSFPKSVEVVNKGAAQIEKTLYSIRSNNDKFVFSVLSDGVATPIHNSIYEYSLTVGGRDLTDKCVVDGNDIVFVPTAENLGDLAKSAGEINVVFKVWNEYSPSLTSSVSGKIVLTAIEYDIIPLVLDTTPINPFKPETDVDKIGFAVMRDGDYMSEDEIKDLIEFGDLKVSNVSENIFEKAVAPWEIETSFKEIDGVTYLVVTSKCTQAPLVACFSGLLLFPGDKTIEARGMSDAETEFITVENRGIFAYVWRIIVLFLILHIIMLVAFMGRVKRFCKGYFVRLSIPFLDGSIQSVTVSIDPVNQHFTDKILWKRIFIPIRYWFGGQQSREMSGGWKLTARGSSDFPLVEGKKKANSSMLPFTANLMSNFKACNEIESKIHAKGVKAKKEIKEYIEQSSKISVKHIEGAHVAFLVTDADLKKSSKWNSTLGGIGNAICGDCKKDSNGSSRYNLIFFVKSGS